jgi:hypothetical protein
VVRSTKLLQAWEALKRGVELVASQGELAT